MVVAHGDLAYNDILGVYIVLYLVIGLLRDQSLFCLQNPELYFERDTATCFVALFKASAYFKSFGIL